MRQMVPEPQVMTALRLPLPMAEKLAELAYSRRITRTSILRDALEHYFRFLDENDAPQRSGEPTARLESHDEIPA